MLPPNLYANWQIMKVIVGLLIGYLVRSDRRDGIEASLMPVSSSKNEFAACTVKSSRLAWAAGFRRLACSPTMRSETKVRPCHAESNARAPTQGYDRKSAKL